MERALHAQNRLLVLLNTLEIATNWTGFTPKIRRLRQERGQSCTCAREKHFTANSPWSECLIETLLPMVYALTAGFIWFRKQSKWPCQGARRYPCVASSSLLSPRQPNAPVLFFDHIFN